MSVSPKQYQQMVKQRSTPSPIVKDCLNAFGVGGLICTIGQVFCILYKSIGWEEEICLGLCSVTMIFIGALLTGLTVYDKIAHIGGAGTLVPITGFANSIVSPAMEFKCEGMVLGLAAKMFVIAGPVLVYGIVGSVVYGVIYYIITLF